MTRMIPRKGMVTMPLHDIALKSFNCSLIPVITTRLPATIFILNHLKICSLCVTLLVPTDPLVPVPCLLLIIIEIPPRRCENHLFQQQPDKPQVIPTSVTPVGRNEIREVHLCGTPTDPSLQNQCRTWTTTPWHNMLDIFARATR